MTTTYTVREPGMACWSEGLTLAQARKDLRQAKGAGLYRAIIIDDSTGMEFDDSPPQE